VIVTVRPSAPPPRPRRASKGLGHVLEALAGREVPVTAQQLFIEMRDQGHALGLATVYRALHVLRDEGRLHEFHVEDGIAFRACASDPHHHLICVDCGRVQDEQLTAMASWLNAIECDDFTVETFTVELYGVCGRCRDVAQRDTHADTRSGSD
jgi:Fur family ferric uptake transcriptional regulator